MLYLILSYRNEGKKRVEAGSIHSRVHQHVCGDGVCDTLQRSWGLMHQCLQSLHRNLGLMLVHTTQGFLITRHFFQQYYILSNKIFDNTKIYRAYKSRPTLAGLKQKAESLAMQQGPQSPHPPCCPLPTLLGGAPKVHLL